MNLHGVDELVRQRLGLDAAALGSTVFARAIEHRMLALGMTTSTRYHAALAADPNELAMLVDALVVPETWFFRGGRELFTRLAQFVAERSSSRIVRILSVPCSTGEEPYSLVIALRERLVPPTAFTIDAVDISRKHLKRATAARFTDFAFRDAGPDIRPTYFRQRGDHWELLPHIRSAVKFTQGNATDSRFLEGEQPYDLILCRNLFIYLTPEARKRVIATLDRLLATDGRLCLTPGEADRLPRRRFVADEPAEMGVYRRNECADEISSVLASTRPAAGKIQTPAAPLRSWLVEPPRTVIAEEQPSHQLKEPHRTTLEVARQLANAGKLAEAREACDQLASGRDDLPAVFTLLGVIHQAEGRTTEAVEMFRKALYLDPNHAEALSHMIVICDNKGDTSQAAALRKRLARVTGGPR